MPVRLLREGILTSERINALTLGAEVFYRRLMSVVDDFGRYYAKSVLLRTACFPLRVDTVKDRDIAAWLSECTENRLIVLYSYCEKHYLQVLDFRQQVRAKESKFPAPDEHALSNRLADEKQMIATAHLDVDVDVDVNTFAPIGAFESFWFVYPKRKSKAQAEKAWAKLKPDDALVGQILRAVEAAKQSPDWKKEYGRFIPYPATWLNAKGWLDEVKAPKLEIFV